MICLDTNIAIYVINRRVPAIRHRLAEQLRLGTEIGFPAIALFELRYGHARSDRRAESDRLLAEFLAPGIAVLTPSFMRIQRNAIWAIVIPFGTSGRSSSTTSSAVL